MSLRWLFFFLNKIAITIDEMAVVTLKSHTINNQIAMNESHFSLRSTKKKEPKKTLTPAIDQNGSQVNFYYGAHTPYAESIAPSHHSTYAHYYDDEEDGWEMPNFYNETYMKESLHNGMNGKMNSLARSNASIYGTKEDLYDRLKRHAYPGKKGWYSKHLD